MHRATALRSYVQLEFLEFTYFVIFRRSPSPVVGDSRPSSNLNRELNGRDSPLLARREKVEITCLGMLYSPIIMQNVEGKVCPDATQFLMAGTQVCETARLSCEFPLVKCKRSHFRFDV